MSKLLLWWVLVTGGAAGCTALEHNGVYSAEEHIDANRHIFFSVCELERCGSHLCFTNQIRRNPAENVEFWGGRTFLTICCYDASGKCLSCNDECWIWLSDEDFNDRGVAAAKYDLKLSKGAVTFTVELQGSGRTKPIPIPADKTSSF